MGIVNRKKKLMLMLFFSPVLTLLFISFSQAENLDLVVLDTEHRESIVYHHFFELSRSAGFTIRYVPLDRLMDEPDLMRTFSSSHGIFCILSIDFLKGMFEKAPLSVKLLSFLKKYCQLKGKLVAFALPSFSAKQRVNYVKGLAPLFNLLGVNVSRRFESNMFFPASYSNLFTKMQQSFDNFFYTSNYFLAHPVHMRPIAYHTMLNAPRGGVSFYDNRKIKKVVANEKKLILLPQKKRIKSKKIKATLPYGLYWYNPLFFNHVFITFKTFTSVLGLGQDLQLCPRNSTLYSEMKQALFFMMQDLKHLVQKGAPISKQDKRFRIEKKDALLDSRVSKNTTTLKKTAWMEINIFKDDSPDYHHRQYQLIDYILTSQLDALWISLTPNIYYSPIAKYRQKEHEFLTSLSRFTEKLQAACQKRQLVPPKILIGFEIADNLYAPNLPKRHTVDLYGNTYHDLPEPLDGTFWDNEVIKSLDSFLKEWQNPRISNGLEISGVVLDLEMYGRKKNSMFLTTMGFEKRTLALFGKKHDLTLKGGNYRKKIHSLIKKWQMKRYFSFLEVQATRLGKRLQEAFDERIPQGIIACYTPTILVDWFYKGLFKGLSTPQKPLWLFTFNTDFAPYEAWFKKNDIQVKHSGALLFSKIATEGDFVWADHVLKRNHGVWLNRFSRLVEDYQPASWVGVEQTPLDREGKTAFMNYLGRIAK